VISLKPLMLSGREVLPLIEGGKGISITKGECSGAWAATGGVGTFSGVNADFYDEKGNLMQQIYHATTRSARQRELVDYAVKGALYQARMAHETAGSEGCIHMNILWEMGAAEEVLTRVLESAKGLIHGVTCGAGMPYKLSEISARFGVYYYPIVSSARAFRALWKRAYYKCQEWLGAVVYEDPWRAGGHNGLSNNEDPRTPEPPYPRVKELRSLMNECGLSKIPIIMAGGVWFLREWEQWVDNPEIGPIAFQFGTRALLTKESPIPEEWKQRLLTLEKGDVSLHQFSPTGFHASAVRNNFLRELEERSHRQIAYSLENVGEHDTPYEIGLRNRVVYLTAGDRDLAEKWKAQGFLEAIRTPDSTLVFVTSDKAKEIRTDQAACMGCLSACRFSNWAQNEAGTTGKKADPRSFCIQKTLQAIAHGESVDNELMFSGHNAYLFAEDPFYSNNFIPTVQQLVNRIITGD